MSKHFEAAFDPKFSGTSKESFAALQSDIDTIENMVENVKGGRVRMSKEDIQIRSDLGSLKVFLAQESPNERQTAKAGTVASLN